MSAFGIPLIGVIGYRMTMLEAPKNLPEKAADLRALLASREVEIVGFKAELRSRDLLIEKLKHQLAGLRRHQFGSRSESQIFVDVGTGIMTPGRGQGATPRQDQNRHSRRD